jgi:uncharacterized protein (DUF1501 family)
MKRRHLLQLGAGLSAAAVLDQLTARAAAGRRGTKTFVLLELQGGNDGLNTLGPFTDAAYLAARPRLAIRDGLPLGEQLFLHPQLAPLLPAWRSRRLAFALGVGWPRPDRSHFFATDQWARADASATGPGWLAAALRQRGSMGPLVALGPEGSPALEGAERISLQMSPASRRAGMIPPADLSLVAADTVLGEMLALEAAGNRELRRLSQALAPVPAGVRLPAGSLGQQVGLALQLLGSGMAPPVLQMALPGFDTHANQRQPHGQRLGMLAEALAAFDQGLQLLSHRPSVTLLTTSEFGRRLAESASGGTDHGSASVALLLGDHVPHPFLGTYPSLRKLDPRGDLIPSISPPELYRQALAL